MNTRSARERIESDAIQFAEQLFAIFDEASFTATYKHAMLLALIDICVETTDESGKPQTLVSTRVLAEKVASLYWPQTRIFPRSPGGSVLRQTSLGRQSKAISSIQKFQEGLKRGGATTMAQAAMEDPRGYDKMLGEIERKLIEDPLPRLQKLGGQSKEFLYEIPWEEGASPTTAASAAGRPPALQLFPDAARNLIKLASLLRPLIHRQWAALVAKYNREEIVDADLETFLFGTSREHLSRIRDPIADLQNARCFYCEGRLSRGADVDHFIPWSRYPSDALANLVVADPQCNGGKAAHLASARHVERWAERNADNSRSSKVLKQVSEEVAWPAGFDECRSAARVYYGRLGDAVFLWDSGRAGNQKFVAPDRNLLDRLLR